MKKILITLISIIIFPYTAKADFVVIKSVNMGYAPGDIIAVGTRMQIPNKSYLILMNKYGKKGKLSGPYNGIFQGKKKAAYTHKKPQNTYRAKQTYHPTQKKHNVVNDATINSVKNESERLIGTVSTLFKKAKKNKRLKKFIQTAMKTENLKFRASSANKTPGTWTIDISETDSNACFTDSEYLYLWHDNPSENMTVKIENDEKSVSVDWEKGKKAVEWPEDMELKNGLKYSIFLNGKSLSNITLHMMPEELETAGQQAEWLTDNSCERQALLLINSAETDNFLEEEEAEDMY